MPPRHSAPSRRTFPHTRALPSPAAPELSYAGAAWAKLQRLEGPSPFLGSSLALAQSHHPTSQGARSPGRRGLEGKWVANPKSQREHRHRHRKDPTGPRHGGAGLLHRVLAPRTGDHKAIRRVRGARDRRQETLRDLGGLGTGAERGSAAALRRPKSTRNSPREPSGITKHQGPTDSSCGGQHHKPWGSVSLRR